MDRRDIIAEYADFGAKVFPKIRDGVRNENVGNSLPRSSNLLKDISNNFSGEGVRDQTDSWLDLDVALQEMHVESALDSAGISASLAKKDAYGSRKVRFLTLLFSYRLAILPPSIPPSLARSLARSRPRSLPPSEPPIGATPQGTVGVHRGPHPTAKGARTGRASGCSPALPDQGGEARPAASHTCGQLFVSLSRERERGGRHCAMFLGCLLTAPTDSIPEEETKELAATRLQRLIRGRLAQNAMFQGM